jgi:hypothetical protein
VPTALAMTSIPFFRDLLASSEKINCFAGII